MPTGSSISSVTSSTIEIRNSLRSEFEIQNSQFEIRKTNCEIKRKNKIQNYRRLFLDSEFRISNSECALLGGFMYTLGINAAFHDSAACLVKDGQVLAAAEDERFTHVKHGKRPIP